MSIMDSMSIMDTVGGVMSIMDSMSIMDTVGGDHVNKLAVYTHVCSTSYNWDSW